jgi:hypothetical protein
MSIAVTWDVDRGDIDVDRGGINGDHGGIDGDCSGMGRCRSCFARLWLPATD